MRWAMSLACCDTRVGVCKQDKVAHVQKGQGRRVPRPRAIISETLQDAVWTKPMGPCPSPCPSTMPVLSMPISTVKQTTIDCLTFQRWGDAYEGVMLLWMWFFFSSPCPILMLLSGKEGEEKGIPFNGLPIVASSPQPNKQTKGHGCT